MIGESDIPRMLYGASGFAISMPQAVMLLKPILIKYDS